MIKPYRTLITICASAVLIMGLALICKDNHTAPEGDLQASLENSRPETASRSPGEPATPDRKMSKKNLPPPFPLNSDLPQRLSEVSGGVDQDEVEQTIISDYQAWTATAGKIIPVDSVTYALRDGFAIAHKSGEWITGEEADLRFDQTNSSVELDIPGKTRIERGSVTMKGDGVNILEQIFENGEFVRTTLFTKKVVVKTDQGEQIWPAGTMITEDTDGSILMMTSNETVSSLVNEAVKYPHD